MVRIEVQTWASTQHARHALEDRAPCAHHTHRDVADASSLLMRHDHCFGTVVAVGNNAVALDGDRRQPLGYVSSAIRRRRPHQWA
jgi:hypothetical protein